MFTQIWFDEAWQDIPGDSSAQSALESFVIKLQSSPAAIFTNSPAYPSLNLTASTLPKAPLVLLPDGESLDLDSSLISFSMDYSTSYDYGTEDAASLIKSLGDLGGPTVTINGFMYNEVQEYGELYIDQGATAYDPLDGFIGYTTSYQLCSIPPDLQSQLSGLAGDYEATWAMFDVRSLRCSSTAVKAVNVNVHGNYSQGYLITYSAVDSRKKQAAGDYRLVVITPRCSTPDKWCPNLSPPRCSVVGKCLNIKFGSTGDFASSLDGFKLSSPPPAPAVSTSKQPPIITLLGNGTVLLLSTGQVAMLTNVTWNSKWQDPGATATGTPYGTSLNLTSIVQALGVGSVDTSVPTDPTYQYSYVVTYAVTDPVGNVATPARRLVFVSCPYPERYCKVQATNAATCTVNGICGLDSSLSASGGASGIVTAAASPPNITLAGPQRVEIDQNQPWDFCTATQTSSASCDRGATAVDSLDGILTSQVRVCGYPTTQSPGAAARAPLLPVNVACKINTSIPGEYTVKFSVTSSSQLTSSTQRTVVVRAVCPVGQFQCQDKLSCSTGGACLSDLGSAAATTTATAAASPSITLLLLGSVSSNLVNIKRGGSYQMCNGAVPTDASPCEPGAIAWDPNLAAGQQNVSSSIVVCPRPDCLINSGCSPQDLSLMRPSIAGLSRCNINFLAPVGSTFRISFYVWTSSIPPVAATVIRTVVITEPCDKALPVFCMDNYGKFYCSAVACASSAAFLLPAPTSPALILLPRNTSTVYVEFGSAPPFSLAPCPSGAKSTSVQSCGAVAYDHVVGSSSVTADLTPLVKVTTSSSLDPDTGLASTCDVQQASMAGGCYTGTYTYTYSVTNAAGAVNTAVRTLIIYRASYVDLSGVIALSGINNATTANSTSSTINLGPTAGPNGTVTKEYKAAVAAVATKMTAFGIVDSDLDLSNASVVKRNVSQKVQVSDISCSVRVWIYTPSSVKRAAIQAFTSIIAALNISSTGSSSGSARRSMVSLGSSVTMDHVLLALQAPTQASPVPAHHAGLLALPQQHPDLQLASSLLEAEQAAAAPAQGNTSALLSPIILGGPSVDRRHLTAAALGSSLQNASNATGAKSTTATTAQPNATALNMASLVSLVKILSNTTTNVQAKLATAALGISSTIAKLADMEIAISNKTKAAYAAYLSAQQPGWANISAKETSVIDLLNLTIQTLSKVNASTSLLINTLYQNQQAQARLTSLLLQRALLVEWSDDALRQVLNTSCYRLEPSLSVSFQLSRFSDPAAGARRKVLASAASSSGTGGSSSTSRNGAGSSPSANTNANSLRNTSFGYFVDMPDSYPRYITLTESTRPRFMGTAANRVVGGLLLHTTRKLIYDDCSRNFAKLSFSCTDRYNVPGVDSSFTQGLFAADQNSIYPYGVDPVFLSSSQLYNPSLTPEQYYNVSSASDEISATGLPYGFHFKQLDGYEDGFPIVFENGLSQTAARDFLKYVKDGSYLDKQSKSMTAEVLAYNHELHVLTYLRGTFNWAPDGGIDGDFETYGLPALDYLTDEDSGMTTFRKVFAHELVPLWTLVIFFCCYATFRFVDALMYLGKGYSRGQRFSTRRCMSLLPYHRSVEKFDLLLAAVLLVGAVLYSVYMSKYAAIFSATEIYKVYDGPSSAAARWLLTQREDPQLAPIDSTAAYTNLNVDAVKALNISVPVNPAQPGRYLLPPAHDSMSDLVAVLASVHTLSEYWIAYGITQAFVIVLLILRLLMAISFQARLSIITTTLVKSAPDLLHVLIPTVLMMLMWAVESHLVIGWRWESLSSLKEAMYIAAAGMLDRQTFMKASVNSYMSNFQLSAFERVVMVVSALFYYFILAYVMVSIVISVLIRVFAQTRYGHMNMKNHHMHTVEAHPTIVQDLSHVVIPDLARWLREQWQKLPTASAPAPELEALPPVDKQGMMQKPPAAGANGEVQSNHSLLSLVEEKLLQGFVKVPPSVRIQLVKLSGKQSYRRDGLQHIVQQQALRCASTPNKSKAPGPDGCPPDGDHSLDVESALAGCCGRGRVAPSALDGEYSKRAATQAGSQLYDMLKSTAFIRPGFSNRVHASPAVQQLFLMEEASSSGSMPLLQAQPAAGVRAELASAVSLIERWSVSLHEWQLSAWREVVQSTDKVATLIDARCAADGNVPRWRGDTQPNFPIGPALQGLVRSGCVGMPLLTSSAALQRLAAVLRPRGSTGALCHLTSPHSASMKQPSVSSMPFAQCSVKMFTADSEQAPELPGPGPVRVASAIPRSQPSLFMQDFTSAPNSMANLDPGQDRASPGSGRDRDRPSIQPRGSTRDRPSIQPPGPAQDRASIQPPGPAQDRASTQPPGPAQDRASTQPPGPAQGRASTQPPGSAQDWASIQPPGSARDRASIQPPKAPQDDGSTRERGSAPAGHRSH